MQFTSVRLLKTILLFALCAVSLLCVPAAQCQDYVRTTIGTVSYTSPLYQQRYNSQGFNPPLVFDIGGTSTSENLFSVVPLTTANVTQFRMIPPAQATIIQFTDPGAGGTGSVAYLEAAQTWSGTQTYGTANFNGTSTFGGSGTANLNGTTAFGSAGTVAVNKTQGTAPFTVASSTPVTVMTVQKHPQVSQGTGAFSPFANVLEYFGTI